LGSVGSVDFVASVAPRVIGANGSSGHVIKDHRDVSVRSLRSRDHSLAAEWLQPVGWRGSRLAAEPLRVPACTDWSRPPTQTAESWWRVCRQKQRNEEHEDDCRPE